ncbi:MAG TPA: alanine racemase [Allosphingosinicella sp.]|uniref:alanine racemase n=1 Tax=Allosphingosinicella sp. TaxID=2823234 RepID=UPI002EDB9FF1
MAVSLPIAELRTPCLLLDEEKMRRNIEVMRDGLKRLGVPLRPHVKTAKCIEAARAMVEGQPGGITVSTLAEADFFLRHGFTDILYAVGIAPGRLPQVAELASRGACMSIILDSVEAARAVADFTAPTGVEIGVFIEIDSGGHRAGVDCRDPVLIEIARALAPARSARLQGVLVHAGQSYDCADTECIAQVAEEERRQAVAAAEMLRASGFDAPIVSVGSTPTATFARSLEGVSEVRAGVYVFHDLVMAGLGVCTIKDIAMSVLTTVIGSSAGKVVVNAGWTALSRDRGTSSHAVDQFYGLVCDADGTPLGDLVVRETNQEHGVIGRRDGSPFEASRFPVGTRLRILPNHACATATMHDRFQVLRDGVVMDEWKRCGGW